LPMSRQTNWSLSNNGSTQARRKISACWQEAICHFPCC
jgi:hypothetical protein